MLYARIFAMDEEDRNLLEHTLRIVEENNKMLRRVRGVQKRAALMSLLYWIFIIGAAIGAFYFIQPYINKVEQIFKEFSDTLSSFQNNTSIEQYKPR